MHHPTAHSFLIRLALCLAIGGTAVSGLFLGGCSGSRAETAATGLSTTSAKVSELKINVNRTNGLLQKLKAGEDVQASYAKLKEQIAVIKANGVDIKSSYEQMTVQTGAVVETWKQEIEAVKDPTLKASSAQRSAQVTESVAEITTNFGQAKDAYRPFVTTLDELVTFLDKDLTPSGMQVAGPTIEKSIKTGIEVQVQLQMLSSKLDTLSGQIAPTMK